MVTQEQGRLLGVGDRTLILLPKPPGAEAPGIDPKRLETAAAIAGKFIASHDPDMFVLENLAGAYMKAIAVVPEAEGALEILKDIVAKGQEAYHQHTGRNIAEAFDLRANPTHHR